ncbi:hypothetical protein [Bacteroides ovatus]|uniref:hypothetical protein n=1 Tax=Bacteroides ovatus TaxID=28116 RepID=UPI0020A82E4D|nr:hypothetical protein [Bacteroides ovatus]
MQHIKLYDNIDETLFVTADDLYFAEHKLIDLAMDFYQHRGKNSILTKYISMLVGLGR